MKPNSSDQAGASSKRFLILSDGKPGHVNQSIAFARHLDIDYDVIPVRFKWNGGKALSYLLAQLNIYTSALFAAEVASGQYTAVVSAGSGTYYANRTMAKQLGCRSVAIMLPSSYPLDFDLIVAQQHDNPPEQSNIATIPINLTYVEPQGLVNPLSGEKYISLIIGGDSHHSRMDAELLKSQLEKIFSLFPDHRVWLTTSRRTPAEVEVMLKKFEYERAVYYSQEPINPIADFLQHSDYVFLTADSSSMISEAVSFGKSCVEVLPLKEKLQITGKINKLIMVLAQEGCLAIFEGSVSGKNKKISLTDVLNRQNLRHMGMFLS